MNWGTFQSANGLALNAAVRLDNNVQLNGGVGYGADENLVGGRVGIAPRMVEPVGWVEFCTRPNIASQIVGSRKRSTQPTG